MNDESSAKRRISRSPVRLISKETSEEDLFLTGMIISDDFMRDINHVMEPRYFKSPHIRTVAEWVMNYFDEFGKTPGNEIQEIFEIESRNSKLADAELIETLLINICTKFENKKFNAGYITPKMILYIRERVVEIALEDARWNLKKKGADAAWETLNKITEVRQKTSKGFSYLGSFDDRFENWYYANKNEIMRMPGALGHYMAPLLRKKLIAFLAPPKRGKSWWLLYVAFIAMTHRLNVAFFSLEMSEEEVEERLAMIMTAHEFGDGVEGYSVPVVDCFKNQDGTCAKSICENPSGGILDEDGNVPEYEETAHMPCSACRRDWTHPDAGRHTSDFDYVPWMDTISKKKLSPKEIKKAIENFKLHFGEDSLRVFTYRIGTATVADMENNLDEEEILNGWVPDLMSVDYADIAKKSGDISERRHQLSDIWEQLSGCMKERNLLGFTASQGNRGSSKKAQLTSDDISEDWGKVMIVDGLMAINENNLEKERTKKDKYWQTQNLQWLAHRYKKDLKEWEVCIVMNMLKLGQVCIDSEIV